MCKFYAGFGSLVLMAMPDCACLLNKGMGLTTEARYSGLWHCVSNNS